MMSKKKFKNPFHVLKEKNQVKRGTKTKEDVDKKIIILKDNGTIKKIITKK